MPAGLSRYPMSPYPDGWFQVAWSDELAAGRVEALHCFGRDYVLYRGSDGRPRVFDAHCPHLGAHLGHGGQVDGDGIRCPFHAWVFDGSGECRSIPYCDRIPPSARLHAHPVVERNGLVMLWHHAAGAPPAWDVPHLAELEDAGWGPVAKRRWKIRTHNQDMAENAVDRAHFRYVHGTLSVPETRAVAEGPCLHVHSTMMLGTPMGEVEGTIESRSWGFGLGHVSFRGIVETSLVSSVTPLDGEFVDVRFSFRVRSLGNPRTDAGVGKALIADIEKQMREDIPIWEHKAFLARPALCEADGPIGAFRQWSRQFYSEAPEGA